MSSSKNNENHLKECHLLSTMSLIIMIALVRGKNQDIVELILNPDHISAQRGREEAMLTSSKQGRHNVVYITI